MGACGLVSQLPADGEAAEAWAVSGTARVQDTGTESLPDKGSDDKHESPATPPQKTAM